MAVGGQIDRNPHSVWTSRPSLSPGRLPVRYDPTFDLTASMAVTRTFNGAPPAVFDQIGSELGYLPVTAGVSPA